MNRRGRHRMRIALMVILCLLFQQVALAAYACTMPDIPRDPVVMAENCAEMGQNPAQEAPALCARHCAPDLAVVVDPVMPVLAIALPPMKYAPVLAAPLSQSTLVAAVPIERSDPPARLRYCSLLI